MSKHAPGGLKAVKAEHFWTVETSTGQRVANTLDAEYLLEEGSREFKDRSEGYAVLFAAAPELLQALKALTHAAQLGSGPYLRSCIRDAEIAIAKTRGEQP